MTLKLVVTLKNHIGFTYNVAIDVVKADGMADDGVSAQCDLAERAQVELLTALPVTDAFHQVLETCRENTTTYVEAERESAYKESYPSSWLTAVRPTVYSWCVY
jgi:hypothetical protein